MTPRSPAEPHGQGWWWNTGSRTSDFDNAIETQAVEHNRRHDTLLRPNPRREGHLGACACLLPIASTERPLAAEGCEKRLRNVMLCHDMISTTVEQPERDRTYRYVWNEPDPETGEVRGHDPITDWPFQGDWSAARLRNPTLKRSVEGEPFDDSDWPSNGYLTPERIPVLTPAAFTDDYKCWYLKVNQWTEQQEGRWQEPAGTQRKVVGQRIDLPTSRPQDEAFWVALCRWHNVEPLQTVAWNQLT